MQYRILSLLGLQGMEILSISEYFSKIFIFVYSGRLTGTCPHCSKRTKIIHEYRPPGMVKHLKIGARQIFLIIFKRRFFCKSCRRSFVEVFPGIAKWQRKTSILDEQIIEYLREVSFSGVKRRLNVAYWSQVKLLKACINPEKPNWEREEKGGGFSLGIDEHSFSGHDMMITLTNLTTPRLITILPSDRKIVLDDFLIKIPEMVRKKISSVAIDMKQLYRLSVQKHLPDTKITVDHFHLIYDANRRIEEERRILQNVFQAKIPKWLFIKNKENLSQKEKDLVKKVFAQYPDLKFYWFIKESLREMYTLPSRREAAEKLTNLIRVMYKGRDSGLTNWADMLFNWQDEILNFFDTKITNAYTEGVNTKLKLIKRVGFGFRNKEVYIRKAILAFLPFILVPHFS